MDRAAASPTVTEFVKDPSLRRHMLAVEAVMRYYAHRLEQDPERWGVAGLLHDFDWEIHPTLQTHATRGAPILRERGLEPELIHAILAHNEAGTGVPRQNPIDYALLAGDEVTGLVTAAVLVRPGRDIRELKLKSLKKKWKDKAFAAGVDRAEVHAAVADFSRVCFDGALELDDHLAHVLSAMQQSAAELELDGRLAAA